MPSPPTPAMHRGHVNAALLISAQSATWTILTSTLAVGLGFHAHTVVLVAFGAIGYLDAIGSLALVHHFRHGLRNDELSDHLERAAHRIVLGGLLVVGTASLVTGLVRLDSTHRAGSSSAGVVLAAVSFVALIVLSIRKQRIARQVHSKALLSDGHLSAIGAAQAVVALAGTAIARWLDWQWADGAATAVIGAVAVGLVVGTLLHEARTGP